MHSGVVEVEEEDGVRHVLAQCDGLSLGHIRCTRREGPRLSYVVPPGAAAAVPQAGAPLPIASLAGIDRPMSEVKKFHDDRPAGQRPGAGPILGRVRGPVAAVLQRRPWRSQGRGPGRTRWRAGEQRGVLYLQHHLYISISTKLNNLIQVSTPYFDVAASLTKGGIRIPGTFGTKNINAFPVRLRCPVPFRRGKSTIKKKIIMT